MRAREAERRAAERLKLHQIHTCFTPLPCRSSLHTSLPLSLSTPHVPVSLQRTASKGVRRFFHRSSASRSFVTTFIKLGKTELPRATPK